MRLTERQARLKLATAVAAAGGQIPFAQGLQGVLPRAAPNLVSRSLLGRNRISPPTLAALGMRRDECGDIHTVEPSARIRVLAVQAEGDAGVEAAAPLPAGSVVVDGVTQHEPLLPKTKGRAIVRGACRAVSASELGQPVEPVGSHLRELARAIDGMGGEAGDGR